MILMRRVASSQYSCNEERNVSKKCSQSKYKLNLTIIVEYTNASMLDIKDARANRTGELAALLRLDPDVIALQAFFLIR